MSSYPAAVLQWAHLVDRFDRLAAAEPTYQPQSTSVQENVLANWLDRSPESSDQSKATPELQQVGPIWMGQVSMYRCTWCNKPSAVLRKCGGCGTARSAFRCVTLG